jgi:hypothetical protein
MAAVAPERGQVPQIVVSWHFQGDLKPSNVSSSPENAVSEVFVIHTMDALSEAVDAHSGVMDALCPPC